MGLKLLTNFIDALGKAAGRQKAIVWKSPN
jgi:hypothetical protein